MTALTTIISAYVNAQRTQQVDFTAVRAHATRADPTLLADPTARARLHDALTALVEQGVLSLPRNTKAYDRRSQPPLPNWVTKPARPRPPTATTTTGRVWPPALEAAAALATRPDELELLHKIADWLRDNRTAQPVPVEERSLEILNDEKALTAEVTKRLFTAGALTLDLLRCYRTPLAFASQHVPGHGPTHLLVAENNATYHSFLMTARAQPETTRPDLHIGWGSGHQFAATIASVPLLDPTPTAVWYFGDLDVAGLHIAVNAARVAAEHDLPPLQPAQVLYQAALRHGRPRPDRSNSNPAADYSTLLAWLPEHLRQDAANLFATGQRIPQEVVGLRLLREEPDLWSELVDA